MQALTGFEQAVGGEGNDPVAGTWIPIDMSGGWLAAIGIAAGLYARGETGRGQQVATSLLGAGMLLQSGVYERDGELVRGPTLDADQTGYGPGYRIYRVANGQWFALVVPDGEAWARLRSIVGTTLPERYMPLRLPPDDADARAAEKVLEQAFSSEPAERLVERFRDADLLVEPIADVDREQFRQAILDDPVNRQFGRVADYDTADWGHFEQIGPLLRCGPEPTEGPLLQIPRVGEHSVEVMAELGIDADLVRTAPRRRNGQPARPVTSRRVPSPGGTSALDPHIGAPAPT
ncbi:MAG: CoA transferase [Acidimicrobiia bacterium]|nr:CoA transferase [Acidimicrobiia bacterium]